MNHEKLTEPIKAAEIEWDRSTPKLYGSYLVHADGSVYSTISGRWIGRLSTHGYVTFWNSDNGKDEKIHRVVASLFLPNPDGLAQVNHKDGNKANNDVSNLEWCNQSANVQHAYDNGLMKKGHDMPLYNSTAVRAFKDGQLVGTFISQAECARSLRLSQGNIGCCLTGKRKSTKGYTFQYE